jgi:N-formylglutamate deformylase
MRLPFFTTIPHSGERVPDFCTWLQGLDEKVLMCDVDRYVDRLYEPTLAEIKIPCVKTQWHRYAADLNRIPQDVDASSVVGSKLSAGSNARGFHWVMTTSEINLMPQPMPLEMHQQLVQLIYEPFHHKVQSLYEDFRKGGARDVYHLDLHSMPGVGTLQHRDPGEVRVEIVVSDCKGKSANPDFVDLVISSYAKAGFKVGYNWPYFGGRVSEQYGVPSSGQHAVQVELNRSLYMDEKTKHIRIDLFSQTQVKLAAALKRVHGELPKLTA